MPRNLIYNTEIVALATTEAAATTTKNTSAVDMQNWDGCVFLGRFKTAATGTYVNIAQSTASGGTYSDLASTAQRNVTNWRIDVYQPRERYLRVEAHRGSVAMGDVWAIKYAQRVNSSSTQAFEFHASPTEGTA